VADFAGTVAVGLGGFLSENRGSNAAADLVVLIVSAMPDRMSPVLLAVALFASAACQEEGTVQVHHLDFNGVKAVDVSTLKDVLATRQSSKLPWGKKAYFDRSRFDADLKRIQAFYADRGYSDARVTGFDVKLNDKQTSVDLTVTVSEGEPVRVEAVDFVGFEVVPATELKDLRKKSPLVVGKSRDRQLVVATHELALDLLRDRGYPYAKVATNVDDAADGKHAKITFTAEPGQLARFGPVQIQGNRTVSDRVIERELSFRPGDVYRRSEVQNTQRRLYGMELFQFVNVESVTSESQSEEVPTRITIVEDRHQRVNFGVGYGTEEKARFDAEYHHLNFFGGARTAGAHVRWSSLDRGIRLEINQPYLFRPHFSLSGEAQDWYTFTPAYNSVVVGVKATVTHRSDPRTSWSISMTSEDDRSSVADNVLNDPTLRTNLIALGLNPITGQQNGTLNALGFDFQHSTSDNLLNAHNGYQLAFHAEQAGHLVPGAFNYYSLSGDGRQYLTIGSIVLASRLQFGNLRPFGADEANIPFAKRYFLGGSTSVRGWGRYEISPLSDTGLPIGGDSMLQFSEELRAVLRGNFGGVLFLDGGNVWAKSWGIKLNDLRYAVGPGLRYQTPVGPVRFDFGYQINPIPGLIVNGAPQTRRWRIHFSIGQAY
jgi:outer membrane protein assembly complex protein YaeT